MNRTSLASLLLLAPWLTAGCGEPGADGAPGRPGADGARGPDAPVIEPGIAGVIPSRVVLDRTVQVTITVTEVPLDETTAVSFGEDIEVTDLEVSGAEELTATLAVGPTAVVGERDVTVTTAEGELSASAAFAVVPALATVLVGSFEQGSLRRLDAENQDDIPFDVATFEVEGPGIGTILELDVTGTFFSSIALTAPTAPPGPSQLVGTNYYDGDVRETFLSAVGAVTVAERAPVDVDTSHVGTLPTAGDTGLYRHAPAPFTGFVEVSLTRPDGATGDPIAWAFGPSGDFDTLLTLFQGTMPIPVHESAHTFFVVTDNELGAGEGTSHQLTFTHVPAQLLVEQNPPHGELPGQPLVHCVAGAALTPCLIDGQLSAEDELDVYRIEGLGAAAGLEVVLESDEPMMVHAQDGAAAALNPWINELVDPWTGAAGVVTDRQKHLAYVATWGDHATWTVVVTSTTGDPGTYRLGVRPRPL